MGMKVESEIPLFTNWTLHKAVKDGVKASTWVYLAVDRIASAMASVPWYVANEKEILWKHHITTLFEKPNPNISYQFLSLLDSTWLELTGNSYIYKVKTGNRTSEIYPISPDRLKPIPSKDVLQWIKGYALDTSNHVSYLPEEIIHQIMYPDPYNPIIGISPLQVAGKVVDIDISQLNFNYNTTQNRGVIEGIFSFDRQFDYIDDLTDIENKITEKYAKKRGFLALGNNAKYTRLGLNPVEMDYSNSRKDNRNEILACFGVHPILVGAMESSTYNNFQTAELIFWTCTIIPKLEKKKDRLNFSFYDELGENEEIRFDISKIPAIRRALLDRAKTAKLLSEMGVPFEQINNLFEFGIEEYSGWDMPYGIPNQQNNQTRKSRKSYEMRSAESEAKARDDYADKKILPVFTKFLINQKDLVIDNLDNSDIESIIREDTLLWHDKWLETYVKTAVKFGKDTEFRSIEDIQSIIEEYLESEQLVLTELGMIADTTSSAIVLTIEQALAEGWAQAEIQQAIYDLGIFAPARAELLARTITGTAASIGQWKTAEQTGAKKKVWRTAGDKNVRASHLMMGGQTRKIDERYSNGAMYPLDPVLRPADRVRCRCSQLFY